MVVYLGKWVLCGLDAEMCLCDVYGAEATQLGYPEKEDPSNIAM